MHLHILGICGTFMGGVAALAREAGHRVTGSDPGAWPPMSTQLEALGVEVGRGWDPARLDPAPDVVVVGNVVSRGNPEAEAVLAHGLRFQSGPQWLAEQVLRDRHVLAVAGTHGKTTTASLLAWFLESAGLAPGFLIGGVPGNFDVSARLGSGRHFVVEADEYDTAFFDKRSKFVHYGPRTLVLNNLEFDHADIFEDLAAIERQFHHLLRTVPSTGHIVVNAGDAALERVLDRGCWSEVERFNDAGWRAEADGEALAFVRNGEVVARGVTPLHGQFNHDNTMAAALAAAHAGVPVSDSMRALASFRNARRRLELVGEAAGVTVYDDFAHHPTAIGATLQALRDAGPGRILAAVELRSNSLRMGVHVERLPASLEAADRVFVLAPPGLPWNAVERLSGLGSRCAVVPDLDSLLARLTAAARQGDRVVLMSNGDLGGLAPKILDLLGKSAAADPPLQGTGIPEK